MKEGNKFYDCNQCSVSKLFKFFMGKQGLDHVLINHVEEEIGMSDFDISKKTLHSSMDTSSKYKYELQFRRNYYGD